MKQRIFIGSSSEGKRFCDAMAKQLGGDFEVVPWHISFPASHTAIEALQNGLQAYDFGVFVLSADDAVQIRGKQVMQPRDNVLFEAGVFMGMHGLRRTFFVRQSGVANFHMLTDVAGVTYLSYDGTASSPDIAVASAVHDVRQAIARVNGDVMTPEVTVKRCQHASKPGMTWPLKLELRVRNLEKSPVAVVSEEFRFLDARPAMNEHVLGGRVHNVAFKRWHKTDGSGHDQYHGAVLLMPGEDVDAWVALDAAHTDAEIDALLHRKAVGQWRYRATWLGDPPKASAGVFDI